MRTAFCVVGSSHSPVLRQRQCFTLRNRFPTLSLWFLVQTHGNQEKRARDSLTAPYRACVVSLPLETVIVVHARRKTEVERAFFARYLFVRDDGQGLPVVRTAPGVSHLPRRGLDPIMVPQEIVKRIEQRVANIQSERMFQMGRPAADLYAPGATVRVTDGPFASFEGVFQEGMNNEGRAKILVSIFGRQSPVELEYSQFEAA